MDTMTTPIRTEEGAKLENVSLMGRQGGNSFVFTANLDGISVVVKRSKRVDGKQRILREFRSLQKLSTFRPRMVPNPICFLEDGSGFVMSLELGSHPVRIQEDVLGHMQKFLEQLIEVESQVGHRKYFDFATDSMVEDRFGIGQIKRRLQDLSDILLRIDAKLQGNLDLALTRYLNLCESIEFDAIPRLILSPSDFGTHNMLVLDQGLGAVFLDFEYFGWDVPEKLFSDTLFHPKNSWTSGSKVHWLNIVSNCGSLNPLLLERSINFSRLNWFLIELQRNLTTQSQEEMHDSIAEINWRFEECELLRMFTLNEVLI